MSDDWSIKIGSSEREPHRVEQIEICENGHYWPWKIKRVNVIRLLGTTAGGKTMLLRNLNHQVAPGLTYHEPPRLCMTAFKTTTHPDPTRRVAAGLSHYTILNDLLEQDYKSTPGLLAQFLKSLGLDPETWGGDQRPPYHLLTSDARGRLDTVFVDHSGEAMKPIADNDPGPDTDLLMSDGLAWVVDSALFPAVQRAMEVSGETGRRILLESLAPNRHPGRDLRDVLADQSERLMLTGQLAKLFAMDTPRISSALFRATILTKADLVLYLLKGAKQSGTPGWEKLSPEQNSQKFLKRFVQGGVQFLRSYIEHRHIMAADAPTVELLKHLSASEDQLLKVVVESVLDFYAEPDRFEELVLDEELEDSGSRAYLHEISCGSTVRLRIASMATSWGSYQDDHAIQHRDLAIGIIARSILGADSELGKWIEKAELVNVIHYFLTAPFVAANQVTFPTHSGALAETPGVQHLLAWSVR